jgi:heme/copper-type cytochrome/quinol oxidase subunit 2
MSSTTESGGAPAYTSGSPETYQQGGSRNGLGTAALVVGIIALITCWTVIGGILLGLLAIIFGFVGRGRAKRGEASNGGAAIAGVVLGLVSLIVAVVIVAAGATFFIHHKKDINNLQSCLNNATSQSQKNSCNQQFKSSVNGN